MTDWYKTILKKYGWRYACTEKHIVMPLLTKRDYIIWWVHYIKTNQTELCLEKGKRLVEVDPRKLDVFANAQCWGWGKKGKRSYSTRKCPYGMRSVGHLDWNLLDYLANKDYIK